jgi:hypothetical protein
MTEVSFAFDSNLGLAVAVVVILVSVFLGEVISSCKLFILYFRLGDWIQEEFYK